jgi:four helix bundle protein
MIPTQKPALQSYRDLLVWQKSMDLVAEVYLVAKRLPDTERYGLISQMQRAAVSIPSNISEGYGRSHRGDYLHHLSVANGSLKEVETQLLLSVRLGYLQGSEIEAAMSLADEAGRMLTSLVKKLNA